MLIKDVMKSPVFTLDEATPLEQTYQQMLARKIRHIPLTREGWLVGMVTDRDIRLATSPLAPEGFKSLSTPVLEVMSRPVLTADPLDPVEEAARVMRERKIGALPVMDGESLVGIVTGIDLLDALLRLTGVEKPSGRLELRLPDRPGELARLTGLLAEQGINIHSLLTYPYDETRVSTVVRVGTLETRRLADELRKNGYDIRWPPQFPQKAG